MPAAGNKPNLILIMTDHFRRDALGNSTPNLKKLAARGTQFAQAYCASPLCMPSRNALITGMFPSENGVCGNQCDPISPELRSDTFMNHLQRAGYYTSLIGKHHYLDRYGLGMDVREDDEALKTYGFDHVFQVVDDGENMHNDDEYTQHLRNRGMLGKFREVYATNAGKNLPHPFSEDDYVDGFIGGAGCDFIRNYSEDRPFYLNLSFVGPHPPYWHPGDRMHRPSDMPAPIGAADSESARDKRAHYMDKCAIIDRQVGRLVEALEERAFLDRTIIIFTSDHGDNLGDYGIWDKRHFYEQSVGVPLFLCGPGIPGGVRHNGPRISRAMVSHVDLYPTVLRLAGIPQQPTRRRQGRDMLAMLHAERDAFHSEIFAELATAVMIRTGNWKLVFDPEQGGVQHLYNLAVDPREQHNLAGAAGYEPMAAQLVERLLSRYIRLRQFTHVKEEQRLQKVHIGL